MLAGRNQRILGGDGYAKPLLTFLCAPGLAVEIRTGIQVKLKLTLPSQSPSSRDNPNFNLNQHRLKTLLTY